jgi:hypothetical protein
MEIGRTNRRDGKRILKNCLKKISTERICHVYWGTLDENNGL